MKIEQKLSTAKNINILKKQIADFYFSTMDKIELLDNGHIIVNNKQMQGTRWTKNKNSFLFYIPHNPLY